MTMLDNSKKRIRSLFASRILFSVLYCGYVVGIAFAGLKLYGYFVYEIPVTRNVEIDDVWNLFYGELWTSGVVDSEATPSDGMFDVLLLGASVMDQVAQPLLATLRERYGERIRLYNLAKSAHTTRDSFLKYSRLKDKHFDLIIVYHGINDCRMNCVPKDGFRDDYSHCAWYDSFQRIVQSGTLSLQGIAAGLSRSKIRLGEPDRRARQYGHDIKTEPAFRRNLQSIVTAAHDTGTPVVLMSFATYLPNNYSEERSRTGQLDYGHGDYGFPVETWGDPAAVIAAITIHNTVIQNIANRFDNVLYIDQKRLLPRNGSTFSDVCHLTKRGISLFVGNLVAVIERRFPVNGNSF
jgi:hypothetical protein